MAYAIIEPPFTLRFREMSKPELKAYYAWFMRVLPARIAELEEAVHEMKPTWLADRSPESLDALGEWFVSQVEVRPRTSDEVIELRSKLRMPIDIPGEELTNRTFSLAMDIGMYFGKVVLESLPGTKWDQPLRNEKFADYGQPVIMGFGSVPLNPVRIVVSAAYGIARKERGGDRLRELYNTWAKMHRM
jgi:hypothetical protein